MERLFGSDTELSGPVEGPPVFAPPTFGPPVFVPPPVPDVPLPVPEVPLPDPDGDEGPLPGDCAPLFDVGPVEITDNVVFVVGIVTAPPWTVLATVGAITTIIIWLTVCCRIMFVKDPV